MKDQIELNIKTIPVVKIGLNFCTMRCPKCGCADLTTSGKHCVTNYLPNCTECGQLLDWDCEKINKKLEPQQKKIDIKMTEINKSRAAEMEINKLRKLQNKLL